MVCTRSDLEFATGRLSQHMDSLTISLWTYVKLIFRYIKSTKEFGLLLNGSDENLAAHGYCEAERA